MFRLWQKFEAVVLKYGVAAILLAVPLYPKFPVIDVPGTYVNIRAEDFLIAFLTLVFLLRLVRKKTYVRWFGDKFLRATLIFLGVGLLAAVSAIFLTQTVIPHVAILHWARRVEYILPLFIAWEAARDEKNVRFYIQVLMVAIIGIFLYALGQIYLNFPVIATQNEEFSKGIALRLTPGARIPSTFAGHYDLAAFLVLTIPIFLALVIKTIPKVSKIFLLLTIFISYWLLLLTASRISFAAFIIALATVLFLARKKAWILPAVILAFGGLLFSQQLAARYIRTVEVYFSEVAKKINLPKLEIIEPPYMVKSYKVNLGQSTSVMPTPPLKRIRDTLTQQPKVTLPEPLIEERSMAIRLNIEWPRALRAFLKNPLLGTGYSSITLASDNDYLRLLGEVGILGFAAFFLVLTRLWEKVRGALNKPFVVGFIAGGLGLLANAFFIDVFEASKVAIIFWTLSGISIAISEK